MTFSCYREGFFFTKKELKKNKEGDRKARTEQTQYMKGREAEGTKIKTENREERREKRNREHGGMKEKTKKYRG